MTAARTARSISQFPPRWRRATVLSLLSIALIILALASTMLALETRAQINDLHTTAARYMSQGAHNALNSLQHTLITADLSDPAALRAANLSIQKWALVSSDDQITASDPPDTTWLPDQIPAGETQVILTSDDAPQLVMSITRADSHLIAAVDSAVLWADTVAPPVGANGYAYLASITGTALALPPGYEQAPHDQTHATESRLRLRRGLDNQLVLGRANPITALDLVIVTETPLRDLIPLVLRIAVLWLGGITLSLLIGEWLLRRTLGTLMTPLEALRHGSTAIEREDYGYRVRLPAHSEPTLVDLAKTYNEMAGRLQVSQQRLAQYNTSIEEIVDQRARELSRKTQQLETASIIARELAVVRSPQALVERVARRIRAQFKIYHAEMLVVDLTADSLSPLRLAGTDPTPTISLRDAETNLAAWSVRHERAVYVPDVAKDPRYQVVPGRTATQCALVIPVKYDDTVIGVLNLEAEHRDAFAKDSIAVLESLASDVAMALHNAQVFEKQETANRDLAQAALRLQQANLIKSRFLLSASQRLSARLSAILTETEAILSGVYGELPENVSPRQKVVLSQSRQLQALVDDMLDLSTIESGTMTLNLAPVQLPPLLTEVIHAARALQQTICSDHDLTISLDVSDDLPPVQADIARLRHILMALLSNAIRFTTSGEVTLKAAAMENNILIRVIDTGPGIPASQRDQVFDVFKPTQSDSHLTGGQTGLGLPLARLLAQLHGGELAIAHTSERGSTFELRLPLGPTNGPYNPPL